LIKFRETKWRISKNRNRKPSRLGKTDQKKLPNTHRTYSFQFYLLSGTYFTAMSLQFREKLVSIIFSIYTFSTFSHVLFTAIIISYKRRQLGIIIFVDWNVEMVLDCQAANLVWRTSSMIDNMYFVTFDDLTFMLYMVLFTNVRCK